MVKDLPAIAGDSGDRGSIPRLQKSPREGKSNPLQYSCLGNPMEGGAWREEPGGPQFIGSQIVGHDLMTEQNMTPGKKNLARSNQTAYVLTL